MMQVSTVRVTESSGGVRVEGRTDEIAAWDEYEEGSPTTTMGSPTMGSPTMGSPTMEGMGLRRGRGWKRV